MRIFLESLDDAYFWLLWVLLLRRPLSLVHPLELSSDSKAQAPRRCTRGGDVWKFLWRLQGNVRLEIFFFKLTLRNTGALVVVLGGGVWNGRDPARSSWGGAQRLQRNNAECYNL